ncbi:hypothetical protein [Dyella sp. SG562]|uniref:hypothetical protein n=1 Tax=Dyella sp. SG562 TaxID=2587017 RepID=UPI001423B229|nr:hypothetical protein [Dyella sp. SG562]
MTKISAFRAFTGGRPQRFTALLGEHGEVVQCGVALLEREGCNLTGVIEVGLLLLQAPLHIGQGVAGGLGITVRIRRLALGGADRFRTDSRFMRDTQAEARSANGEQQERASDDGSDLHAHAALPVQPAVI